jgi:hypothetical protein
MKTRQEWQDLAEVDLDLDTTQAIQHCRELLLGRLQRSGFAEP